MSPRLGRMVALRCVATMAIALGTLGCQDAPFTGASVPEPHPFDARRATLMSGHVDADGSVSFEPVGANAPKLAPGVGAAIYGDQNVTVRLYSSDFAIDSTSVPGRKKWTFSVGLRNYLDYPIGSNQSGAQPDDTLGVYVVIVADPVVTSSSTRCSGSSCTVKVDSTTDGVGNFTVPGQKYYYWRERLAARQPVAGADTTSVRRRWVFTGPAAITGFRFMLMVNAAWPPPHEANWHVYYDAASDSLPDTQAEPRWKQYVIPTLFGLLSPGSRSWSPSGLVMSAANRENLFLYRSDSLAANESAYIEARLSVRDAGGGNTAGVILGLTDPNHQVAIGVTDGKVGFVGLECFSFPVLGNIDCRWEFIGVTHPLPRNGGRDLHRYRLLKFGADSARLELDDTRVLATRISQFPDPPGDARRVRAFFGVIGNGGKQTATWSHITYNFGTTQP